MGQSPANVLRLQRLANLSVQCVFDFALWNSWTFPRSFSSTLRCQQFLGSEGLRKCLSWAIFRGCLASMRSNSSKFESNSPREHKKPDLFCFVSSWTTPLKNYKRNNRTAAEIEKRIGWSICIICIHIAFPRSGKTEALGFRPWHVIWQVFHCDLVPRTSCNMLGCCKRMQKEDFKKLPRYGAYPRTILMGKGW